MEMKQAIVVRADLKMSKGKIAAQASHASVECVLNSSREKVKEWRLEGMKKVVLKVGSLKELAAILQAAKDDGLTACMITDAGRTEVEPGSKTCVGIGPDDSEKIDMITSKLKML